MYTNLERDLYDLFGWPATMLLCLFASYPVNIKTQGSLNDMNKIKKIQYNSLW